MPRPPRDPDSKTAWCREFTDATGLFYAEIVVDPPEQQSPAVVRISDIEPGFILNYDARELGLLLIEAADECERQNDAAVIP